ncbi:hypothetical protein DQ04_10181030, partial [Trypanosoma grayi]|uniref:hypothetical protein n=1 Tax=Trypanosoma grayi TaxID=71804 RepID=UPI0004F4B03D
MYGELGHVSFAFITPTVLLPCRLIRKRPSSPQKGHTRSLCASASLSSSRSSDVKEKVFGTKDDGKQVHVRFFDTLRKVSRTQCFYVQVGSTMAYMNEMVHAWLPEIGALVFYTMHSDTHGRLFSVVKDVLHPEMEVPKLFFCQEVFIPPRQFVQSWGVVNIVVLQSHGDIVSGYIPLILHRSSMSSREAVHEQIRRLCCASPAEVDYMKLQPLLNSTVHTGLVNLTSYFDTSDGESTVLPQIAVVYPALVAGDLVRVDMVDRMKKRFSVQGMVKSSRRKD